MLLAIEKLVYGGDGLARLPGPDGRSRAVFVPFVLPSAQLRRVHTLPGAAVVTISTFPMSGNWNSRRGFCARLSKGLQRSSSIRRFRCIRLRRGIIGIGH